MSAALLLLLASCADAPEPAASMDPRRLLTRASLDLRGVRPSLEELDRAEADPAEVDALIDEFLHDPRFESRILALFSEVYLTRADWFYVDGGSYGVDSADFARSVGEEPLRILGYVAANDLPWTEIVTGDWTLVNSTLAAAWPTDYPEGERGWQKAHYTDGRPAAGVLSTNGMWWRYLTTDSNANRGRANAASRILLCNDYLVRPIEFERNVNLLDTEAINDALQNDPGCANCHNSLDPFASFLFGFYMDYFSPTDAAVYHPERERYYRDFTGIEPAFYGQPGYSLEDLAGYIAADNRFPECAVEQVFELLLRRETALSDFEALSDHRDAFIGSDLKMRALFRSVMSDPRYRSPDTDEEGYVPIKMVTPDLLASQIEDLTGFRWEIYGYDMLGSDLYGLRTLAGGADGVTVTRNSTSPNTTLFLVQERLAEAAAAYAVETDRGLSPSERRIFTEIDFNSSDPDMLVDQIQALHRQIFGARVAPDGQEVAAALTLWQELYHMDENPAHAWTGVLTAMLRDPTLLFY